MIIDDRELQLVKSRIPHKRLVLAFGIFDILHPGHLDYLSFAKEQGDVLVVAIPCDASVRAYKGDSRPVNDEVARALMLDALSTVDMVYIHPHPYMNSTGPIAKLLRPDAVVIYNDWPADRLIGLQERVSPATVVVCNMPKRTSTTSVIDKILAGKKPTGAS